MDPKQKEGQDNPVAGGIYSSDASASSGNGSGLFSFRKNPVSRTSRNPRPISTPGSTSESITNPGGEQKRTRTRWIVIGGVIGVLIIGAIVLSIVASGRTSTSSGEADSGEETTLSEEDTKTAFYKYLSYLFFGDETNQNYGEVWDKITKDPTSIDTIYASEMLKSESADDKTEYFTKLNDIFTPFANSYSGTSNPDTISAFYYDYAILPNISPDSLATVFEQSGESGAESYVDSLITTESTNETVIQYVELEKAMLKAMITLDAMLMDNGCKPTAGACDIFTSSEPAPEEVITSYAEAAAAAAKVYGFAPSIEDLQIAAISALNSIYNDYNNTSGGAE